MNTVDLDQLRKEEAIKAKSFFKEREAEYKKLDAKFQPSKGYTGGLDKDEYHRYLELYSYLIGQGYFKKK